MAQRRKGARAGDLQSPRCGWTARGSLELLLPTDGGCKPPAQDRRARPIPFASASLHPCALALKRAVGTFLFTAVLDLIRNFPVTSSWNDGVSVQVENNRSLKRMNHP